RPDFLGRSCTQGAAKGEAALSPGLRSLLCPFPQTRQRDGLRRPPPTLPARLPACWPASALNSFSLSRLLAKDARNGHPNVSSNERARPAGSPIFLRPKFSEKQRLTQRRHRHLYGVRSTPVRTN